MKGKSAKLFGRRGQWFRSAVVEVRDDGKVVIEFEVVGSDLILQSEPIPREPSGRVWTENEWERFHADLVEPTLSPEEEQQRRRL